MKKIATIALMIIALSSCKKTETKPVEPVQVTQTQVNNKNYWTMYIRFAITQLNTPTEAQAHFYVNAYSDTLCTFNSQIYSKDTLYKIPFTNVYYQKTYKLPRTSSAVSYVMTAFNYSAMTWTMTIDTTLKQQGPVLNYSNLNPVFGHKLKFK